MAKGGMRNYPKFNENERRDKLVLPHLTTWKEAWNEIPHLIDRR